MHNDEEPERALNTRLGFVFVRGFLWWVMACFAVLLALLGYLSWHFSMDISVRADGHIQPLAYHQVKAAVDGIVREVLVREGETVVVGQRLAVLRDAHCRLDLDRITKDLAANRWRVEELEALVEEQRELGLLRELQARAQLRQSQLTLQHVRAEQKVVATGLLAGYGWRRKPLHELWPVRQARAGVDQRQAEWAAARAQTALVDGQLRELQSLDMAYERLKQDKAYLLRRLAQTVISAPADGVVLTRNVAKRVGDQIAAGEVLLEMVGSGGWLAEVAVAERDLPKIEAGQSARIYVEAYPHMEYQIFDGVVRSLGVESTPGGSYPVRVALRDSVLKAGGYRLAVGMKTEARIVVERGRIVELAWVRLMRSLGKVHKEELYVAAGL